MSYFFSQGFRLVVPYLDSCRSRVKAAWVGRKIEQVRTSPLALCWCGVLFACRSCALTAGSKALLGSPFSTQSTVMKLFSIFF